MTKIYDSIFKTMVTKNPGLLIPLINEVFGTNYDQNTKVLLLSDNHQTEGITESENGEIITDSYIIIQGNNYHIECQSNPDGTMVLRMIEYDFHIALDDTLRSGGNILKFPKSAVLYLRHNSSTPDNIALKILFPSGETVNYSVPIIKVKNITKDTIIEKKLYFLLPYYIMRLEDEPLKTVMSDMNDIIVNMEKCYADGILTDYDIESVYNHIQNLVNNVYNSDTVKEGVDDIMGGNVLYTRADELIDQGIEQGVEKGKNQILTLNSYLIRDDRLEDLKKSTTDSAFLNQLLKEYELI